MELGSVREDTDAGWINGTVISIIIKMCHYEVRSNPQFAEPPCLVRDCFVPRNDAFRLAR